MRLVPTASILAIALAATTAAAQIPANRATPSPPTAPAAPERDPEAIAALDRMGAHLRTLTTFAISSDVTTEEVLDTGQSIQYTGAIDLIAQRPDHLRANVDSTRKRRQFFYDGRTLTIWAPRQGFYATVPAPPTIREMVETASERLGLVVPLSDMFELGLNPELTSRITAATLVGLEAVGDQKCLHYAFRQPNVDWEIWIREGDQPLPCMYRITDLRDPARPDFVARLTWDMQPVITAETFTFVAPDGAERIPVATATASAQGARR